jgi:hypothetical protein
LAQRAFLRILEGERAAHFAGKADQRALLLGTSASLYLFFLTSLSLLARLAVHRTEDDSVIDKLRDHILADLSHRMDLLLDWMFEEFRRNDSEVATDEKKLKVGSTRYARVLLSVLKVRLTRERERERERERAKEKERQTDRERAKEKERERKRKREKKEEMGEEERSKRE